MKLILEGLLIPVGDPKTRYAAKLGEHLHIHENHQGYLGESLKVLSGPHTDYLAGDVYTVELQNVPVTCPFIKYPPLSFTPGTGQGVLQCVFIHIVAPDC